MNNTVQLVYIVVLIIPLLVVCGTDQPLAGPLSIPLTPIPHGAGVILCSGAA